MLDLAQGLAGPYAAGMLAAMGADVVKVEPPEGDWARLMGEVREGHSTMGLPANWGKRAICVDARQPAGKAVLRRLAAEADVVVESFRPGVMTKLGLDYASLEAARPGIVLASISGFGQDGPYVARPGTDTIIQAFSGMASMNRDTTGTPRRVGMLAVDMVTGLYAGYALSAALFDQRVHGQGRHLQISLLQAAAAFQMTASLQSQMRDGRAGTPVTSPSGFYPTRNGMMAVACLRDGMFLALADALDRSQWAHDARYADNAGRIAHNDELNAELAAIFATRDREEWIERLNAAGVLCGPVNDYADLAGDPQVQHMGLFTEIDTPGLGPLPLAGLPCAGLSPADQRPDPPIGGHTRQVLVEAGYTPEEIGSLIDSGVCLHAAQEQTN
ncbi:CoA-transferase family III family protein 46 [Salinisphaera sp. T31B1]